MIYATFPNWETAVAAGRDLVASGLAASVNVLPSATSIYVWKGDMVTKDEAVLVAKLASEGADRAVAHLTGRHPYEVPGVLVVPVAGGNADYLTWIRDGTRG